MISKFPLHARNNILCRNFYCLVTFTLVSDPLCSYVESFLTLFYPPPPHRSHTCEWVQATAVAFHLNKCNGHDSLAMQEVFLRAVGWFCELHGWFWKQFQFNPICIYNPHKVFFQKSQSLIFPFYALQARVGLYELPCLYNHFACMLITRLPAWEPREVMLNGKILTI